MKTKDVVFAAIIGALYAVLTLGIAPLSYGPVQFRVSEFLKVFALFNPWTGVGIAIGDIISGMASPFVSAWELVFMPITDMLGAFLAYWIFQRMSKRYPVVPMLIYALTTSASVAFMLVMFGIDLFIPLFISVGISEVIILVVSVPIGYRIKNMLDAKQSMLLQ